MNLVSYSLVLFSHVALGGKVFQTRLPSGSPRLNGQLESLHGTELGPLHAFYSCVAGLRLFLITKVFFFCLRKRIYLVPVNHRMNCFHRFLMKNITKHPQLHFCLPLTLHKPGVHLFAFLSKFSSSWLPQNNLIISQYSMAFQAKKFRMLLQPSPNQ